jgi:hypothetical protein
MRTMTGKIVLGLIVIGCACGGERRDTAGSGAAAADSGRAAQPPQSAPDAACDSIIALGDRVLAIELRRTDERRVENPFVDPAQGARAGCRVTGGDPTDRAPDPVGTFLVTLEAAGWTSLSRFQADGPDGSVVGLLRGGVICIVRGQWDGGDDSDSTYVPDPGYQLEGTCFTAEPADTVTAW